MNSTMATTPQSAQYVKMLIQHLDRIAVGVVLCLFGAMFYMLFAEQTSDISDTPAPKVAVLPDIVGENSVYKMIPTLTKTVDIRDYPVIDQVAKYNMFDFKAVKLRETIERQTAQQLAQAKEAVTRGDKDEAKRLLKAVLDAFPGNTEARDLLNKLDSPGSGVGSAASGAANPPSGGAPKP
jgi:hypothetical protein